MRMITKHLEFLPVACLLVAGGIGESRAEITILEKEVVSREIVLSVSSGAEGIRNVASREYSMLMHNGAVHQTLRPASREISLIVTDTAVPAIVTELEVEVSPTGETAGLDWSNYNELLQGDVLEYRIYVSDTPFDSIDGMTAYTNLPAGVSALEIGGLAAWQDHYFAVVAVDELGGYNPTVSFSAAYVLSPEIVSREFSVSIGSALVARERNAISREFTAVVTTPEPPAPVDDFLVDVSPTGDSAELDWTSYNGLLQRDLVRYDIYYSTTPFTNVSAMAPFATVQAETQSILLSGLAPWTDHYFAIVPVDALENYEANVVFGAAYVLAPEVVSRELSLFMGAVPASNRDAVSRELTAVVSDGTVPEPVTGTNGTYSAIMSTHDFQSVDLEWVGYNELLQRDVARYRIYVGPAYFEDVSGMEPFTYAPAGAHSFTLSGLDAFGIYYVAVVAEDAEGNFNPAVRAASAQASTSGVGDVGNLQVACGETDLAFSWDPPTDAGVFLDHYNLYFAGATEPETLPSDSVGYAATNLAAAHGYPFRITTVDIFDFESSGVSLLAATLLDNPANVVAEGRDRQVALAWDDISPIELLQYYAVYQSDAAFSNVAAMAPINTTTGHALAIGGLANYSNYYFAVVAVNVAGGFRTNVLSVAGMPEPDLAGPQVAALVPDEPFRVDDTHVEQLFSGFNVGFNEEIQPASFSINDVAVSNSAGAVEVLSVLPISGTQFHVDLAEAYVAGSNTVMIGTNVLDLAGNHAGPFETVVVLSNPALPPGSGDGLLGTYYNGQAFEGSSFPRIDGPLALDWHANAPMPEIGTDHFSSRWTGQIEPRFDGNYTLSLAADDHARLWIDGDLVIDGSSASTNLALANGRRYDIRIDYFEGTGDASILLQWQFETLPVETVPQGQLYSGLPFGEFAAMPTMSPPPGSYVGITLVELATATDGADIYYTLGGSDPYGDWTPYTGSPVALDTNETLRAIAVKSGLNDSGIRVGEYAVDAISYNLWIAARFPGETNLAIIGRLADPDFDGVPNIVEYAYALNPNDPGNERRIALEPGNALEHWMVAFAMPSNQTSGSFCWSPDLAEWIDAVIEKTNGVWVSRSNHCEIATQQPLEIDTLLPTDAPIFFRFDRATEVPLAVEGADEMQVGSKLRKQEWFANFYLRAEDPTIHPFLEIRTDLMSGDWLPPATFAYSNQTWSVDNTGWSIAGQDETDYSEWSLRVKLPPLPINSPVFLRYSVRDDLE